MIVYRGAVITCDRYNTVATYLVENAGRILFVGDALPEPYRGLPVTELGEKALLPSFADTHLHFASFALFNGCPDLSAAQSNADITQMLKSHAAQTERNIIMAYGASPLAVKERRLISRAELDAVSSDKPVMVVNYEGHSCIVNQALMDRMPKRVGALRGYNAETGEMKQEAFYAVSDFSAHSVSSLWLIKSMAESVDALADKGIGMAHTVSGVGFPMDMDVELERIFARGVGGGFQLRVFYQTMNAGKVKRRGFPRVGGCFANALDGSFCSLDAALTEPYEGTDNKGVLFYSDEEVTAFCIKANRAGLQIELHAIGDAAFEQAARALKAALDDCPRQDHRHGIIHAFLPNRPGMDICAAYGIQIPVQPAFFDWPMEPNWHLYSILGDRAARLSPLKSFLDNRIMLSMGSDAPCTRPDPIQWIHNACNHPIREQSVSVAEALRMATWNGYWTSFDEKERGSLKPGKTADMIVLSENPYAVPVSELSRLRVERLMLAGRPYQKQSGSVAALLLKGLLSRKKY